ncbi:MAG: chemotaxis protein CheD [archaeon]
MELSNQLIVDMGKFVIAHNPDTLCVLGIGSCIAVVLYDLEQHIGGLAHVMLPDSKSMGRDTTKELNLNKFADVAIPNMLSEMQKKGCKKERIKAKIAGGAHMFKTIVETEILEIGKRNIEAVKSALDQFSIPLIGEDTGGSCGRTVRFDISTGVVTVRTINGIFKI